MAPRRSVTYLLAALAVLLVVITGAGLGLYLDTRPVIETPGPTVTETQTSTVTTKPKVRTRTVPGPQTTVTKTVPGPTVTKTIPGPTVTVTETHTETVIPEPETPTPGAIVLSVDTAMDAGWQVAQAAEAWNTALGCDVFSTEVPMVPRAGQAIYWLSQTQGLVNPTDGQGVWALHYGAPEYTITFNAEVGISAHVAIHELGHALGLHHGDEDGSVMNVGLAGNLRMIPSAGDIATALATQVALGRCA